MAKQRRRDGLKRGVLDRQGLSRSHGLALLPRLEDLEARRLLTVAINEFGQSGSVISPVGITRGPDDNLWFTEFNSDISEIGRITPSGAIAQYAMNLPLGSKPTGIVTGPDQALWFTEIGTDQIGRISTSGAITNFAIPTANSQPDQIALGSDGALWFTELSGNQIGRIDTSGNVMEFAIPTLNSQPVGIVSGPDGALWFSESNTDKIGRIDTSGFVLEFATGITSQSAPTGITLGPDNNLWFTELKGHQIGRIDTNGVVTEFAQGISPGGEPAGITAGPDGRLWFTEQNNGKVGAITVDGSVTEYTSPSINSTDDLTGITSGPDGNLWSTALVGQQIDRISTVGNVTQFPATTNLLTSSSSPQGITAGPDSALWFTEANANQVGRIDTTGAISEFSQGISSGAMPEGITLGPVPTLGGTPSLWFTESGTAKIGEISTAGVVTEFSGLTAGSTPEGITLGPDNNLWFAENSGTIGGSFGGGAIGRITPGGMVTEFSVGLSLGVRPVSITNGPDGNLWFTATLPGGGEIGKITPTGLITEYPIPTNTISGLTSSPSGITAGQNNDLYFTDPGFHSVGRITTLGVIQEFSTGLTANDVPNQITLGPDGDYWFTDPSNTSATVGRITQADAITLFPTPTASSSPSGITLGPDQNLWFGEAVANQVGQVITSQSITKPTGQPATVIATVPASFTVATFQEDSTAANAANFVATIDFGDGTSGIATVLPLSMPGSLQVVTSHTYATVGNFTAHVTIGTATGNLAPLDVAITANSPQTMAGTNFSGISGRRANTGIATFTDLDTTSTATDFSATVTWSDSTTSAANLTFLFSTASSNVFEVNAGHTFATSGSFVNAITILDNRNGLGSSGNATAIIASPAPLTPFNEVGPSTLTPGAGSTGITLGPDQALWFTETSGGRIGRVDTSGNLIEYAPPVPESPPRTPAPTFQPTGITTGPDGKLWFTDSGKDQIDQITTAGDFTNVFGGLTVGARPDSIVTGPDHNLWFTEVGANQIGRITTSGVVTEFSAGLPGGFKPDSITTGPDGNLWFVGQNSSFIGRITPQGVITEFPGATGQVLTSITRGLDGNLWFTEQDRNRIGQINPLTFVVTEYTDATINGPTDITTGPDGNLWFSSGIGSNQVERITTAGVVTSFSVGLTPGSVPLGITSALDGNLYFVENAGDRIGQVILPATSVTNVIPVNPPGQTVDQSFTIPLASFNDLSTLANLANFQAQINWGDQTFSIGIISAGSSGFAVTGSHTYASTGTFQGSLSIANPVNGSAPLNFSINVVSSLQVNGFDVSTDSDRTFTAKVADFTDSGGPRPSGSYTVNIHWGDKTVSVGTVVLDPDGKLDVIGSHRYSMPGSYAITTTVQVTSSPADAGSAVSRASVASPVLTSTSVTIAATQNILFHGPVASFTDSSASSMMMASSFPYNASIDWGDGSPVTQGTIVQGSPGFQVVGDHVYTQAGSFAVTIQINNPSTMDTTSVISPAIVAPAMTITPPPPPPPPMPLSFVVTNTNDSGAGSLRQAILNADIVADQTISFAIPGPGFVTIQPLTPLPEITNKTVVDGFSEATFARLTATTPLVELDGRQLGQVSAGLVFGANSVGSLVQGLSIFGFVGAQVELDASNEVVRGNFLGLRADGTEPVYAPSLHFGTDGILVRSSYATIAGNVISGNAGQGIELTGVLAAYASVVGNRVGLDPTGLFPRGNASDGIAIDQGAAYETIGPGNLISGNQGQGVELLGSHFDRIFGNFVGTDLTGSQLVGNGNAGLLVDQGSTDVTIGGTVAGSANVLSGNGSVGVVVQGGSTRIAIEGNRIGTDLTGEQALGNGVAGVLISEASGNVVGPGNLISANGTNLSGAGVWVEGSGSTSNLVVGNKVGTDLRGNAALANRLIGVLINDASGNTIGGTDPGSTNLISGNGSIGVMIAGLGGTGNQVLGNLVGTNATGLEPIPNGSSFQGAGVYIDNAPGNTVGPNNVISGNGFDGIQVFGPSSSRNILQGNKVGTDLTGTRKLGNGNDGLVINGAPGTRISSNLIAANANNGITLSGSDSSTTVILANLIGQGGDGERLGNGGFGILVVNGASLPGVVGGANVNNSLGPIRVLITTGASASVARNHQLVAKQVKHHAKIHPKPPAFRSKPVAKLQHPNSKHAQPH